MTTAVQPIYSLAIGCLALAILLPEQGSAHPPQQRPANLPIIAQVDSPIQFDVTFWPAEHILAGESVTMKLTLRNVGTQPFRIPLTVPDIYQARINLDFDLPNQPVSIYGVNAFFSALDLLPERDWPVIRQWTTVEPGQTHIIRSDGIFGEASRDAGGVSLVGKMDQARVRVLVFLDDGNFVASDWVEFRIQQPNAREEDWRDDITRLGVGDVSSRIGLLKQSVGDDTFWFIATERDGHLTHLRRMPISVIRQVIPPEKVGGRLRNMAVLGTDTAGRWHYYGRLPADEGQRGRRSGFLDLGLGKTWRMQLNNEDEVEIIEAR